MRTGSGTAMQYGKMVRQGPECNIRATSPAALWS